MLCLLSGGALSMLFGILIMEISKEHFSNLLSIENWLFNLLLMAVGSIIFLPPILAVAWLAQTLELYRGWGATLFLAASAALAFSLYLSLINFGLFYWILKEDGILHFTVAGAGAMALLSLSLQRKQQAVIPSKNL